LAEAKQRFQCVGKLFAASQCAILKIFWIYQNSASPDQNRRLWLLENRQAFQAQNDHPFRYKLNQNFGRRKRPSRDIEELKNTPR
jgi:hypothetical protein